MIPINYDLSLKVSETDFKEYFDDELICEDVLLLSEKDAEVVWESMIKSNKNHFFELDDKDWISNASVKYIGEWIDDYNSERYKPVAKKLKKSVRWFDKSKVFFILSRTLVFCTSWKIFWSEWDQFLTIEDDAPIIMSESVCGQAIMFYSRGDIVLVEKKEVNRKD